MTFSEDPDGSIWTGMHRGALVKFAPDTREIELVHSNMYIQNPKLLFFNTDSAICTDMHIIGNPGLVPSLNAEGANHSFF